MKNLKLLALVLLLASCFLPLTAQVAGTSSTYSRFGLGVLHDQSNGFNRSMGGVGIGVRIGNRVNAVNPASYSAIDSLSLLFDVGMKASFGTMKQDAKSVGVKNAALDFVHVGFHAAKRLGVAVGFMPYTSIGYEFSSPEKPVANNINTTQLITSSNAYSGKGGLNQAYIGLGWKAYRNFSVGANVSFVWGKYDHYVTPFYKEGGVDSDHFDGTLKNYTASIKTYKIDFGAQYPIRLTRQDWLTLGATAGLGHKIAQDATLLLDTTQYTAPSPFDLPYTFGFGAAWQHKNTLLVAADVHHERWGNCRMPAETSNTENPYIAMKGFYCNMTKFAIGSQWTPNPFGKYWERVQYRAGFNYATPYLKVNGMDGPKELSLSIGAGLPILNGINSRSVVNVGLQWQRRSASGAGMIKEDYFVINLGVTFNERWFLKYKIE